MSTTGSAIERISLCAVTRLCFVIPVANAVRLWAVITAISAIQKRMTVMNSYPQIKKVIHTLWESPKNTLILATYLTNWVRSTLSTRAPLGASSRRAPLSGVPCNRVALLVVNKS
jgi:hypothetical protein